MSVRYRQANVIYHTHWRPAAKKSDLNEMGTTNIIWPTPFYVVLALRIERIERIYLYIALRIVMEGFVLLKGNHLSVYIS